MSNTNFHISSKEFHQQVKRSVLQSTKKTTPEHWIYNLTGDTLDIGTDDGEADREIQFERVTENVASTGKNK